MAKRTSKERALRKKRMSRRWQPFVERPVDSLSHNTPGKPTQQGYANAAFLNNKFSEGNNLSVWENNRYLVHRENVPEANHDFTNTHIVWLSIKAIDDSARHDWREFQWIKNELCGDDWEAIEVYPSEKRMVDSCNQFHMWCFEPPFVVPLGWWERFVVEENSSEFGSQRLWEEGKKPEDLIPEKDVFHKERIIQDLLDSGRDKHSITREEVETQKQIDNQLTEQENKS